MDPNKLGIAPLAGQGEGEDTGAGQDGGQHSENGAGTAADAGGTQPPKKPEGQQEAGAGAGQDGGGEGGQGGEGDQQGEKTTKRINDLMGKWQGEESSHRRTKTQLDRYKEQFGELDGGGKPVKPQPAGPALSEEDKNLPAALKKGWAPQTMEDLQEGLKQAALHGARIANQQSEERTEKETLSRQQAEDRLDDFVVEIRKADPEFDDKTFFQFVKDSGFEVESIKNLRAAYRSYVAIDRAKRSAVDTAIKNKGQRGAPVNKPGSGAGEGGGIPFSQVQQATSAKDLITDFLSGQKKN